MVSPKTLVENPWPWLGRLPECIRQRPGLTPPSGRGPVPPVSPWPSVALSYQPGGLCWAVTVLVLQPVVPAVVGDDLLTQQCICPAHGPLCL